MRNFGVRNVMAEECLNDSADSFDSGLAAAKPSWCPARPIAAEQSTVHPKHKVLAAGQIRDNHQGLRHLGDAVAGRIVGAAEADALTI